MPKLTCKVLTKKPDCSTQGLPRDKDSVKYAATGGWGHGQFDKDGKLADETPLKTCFPCHENIFTHYAP